VIKTRYFSYTRPLYIIMKKTSLTLLFLLIFIPISAQIETEKQALVAINWIVENPQIESDSLFVNKSAELIKWQFFNYPKTPIEFGGLSEFMDKTNKDYNLYKEITVVYMFSSFIAKIKNKNYSIKKSTFYAINSVLKYYKKALEMDHSLSNKILDNYVNLSEKELKKKINSLIK
jgi:hypothetical protein